MFSALTEMVFRLIVEKLWQKLCATEWWWRNEEFIDRKRMTKAPGLQRDVCYDTIASEVANKNFFVDAASVVDLLSDFPRSEFSSRSERKAFSHFSSSNFPYKLRWNSSGSLQSLCGAKRRKAFAVNSEKFCWRKEIKNLRSALKGFPSICVEKRARRMKN